MGRERRALLQVGLLALLLGAGLGLVMLTEAMIEATCGQRPTAAHPFAAFQLLLSGSTAGYAPIDGCEFPVTPIRWLALGGLVVVIGGAMAAMMAYARWQGSDAAFIADLKSRSGFATAREVRKYFSASSVLRNAKVLRPTLTRKPVPADVGWPLGESRGVEVYISIEDSVVLEAPPRGGKGFRVLISAILDWSGPLITTSTTNDNLTASYRSRQQRGTVHVFDPQGVSGLDRTLRYDPIRGCADPLVASQRGRAIINGTALGSSTTNGEWAEAAATILTMLLHAAAVGNKTVAELHSWGSSPGLARGAVDILRMDGAPGWGDSLEAVLDGDPRQLGAQWFGVQSAVSPLAIPQIRENLTPRPGDEPFDPATFLSGENTLYLLGSSSGAGAMGGFLSAMLDDIVEVARKIALASPGSRLPLPLGLILDEIANMFRWEALPRVMADGGGRGICTLVSLQALSQAETSWSAAEATTIWSAATARILLGGAGDAAHLRDIESLLGTRERRREQRSWNTEKIGHSVSEQHEKIALMTVDEIRRMPTGLGLLTYRNRRPALLELDGWIDRKDAGAITAGKRQLESEQQTFFASRG
ncbi:type IV secretory system conjugative DNA transfer family protein [Microbacterium arborescens]